MDYESLCVQILSTAALDNERPRAEGAAE